MVEAKDKHGRDIFRGSRVKAKPPGARTATEGKVTEVINRATCKVELNGTIRTCLNEEIEVL